MKVHCLYSCLQFYWMPKDFGMTIQKEGGFDWVVHLLTPPIITRKDRVFLEHVDGELRLDRLAFKLCDYHGTWRTGRLLKDGRWVYLPVDHLTVYNFCASWKSSFCSTTCEANCLNWMWPNIGLVLMYSRLNCYSKRLATEYSGSQGTSSAPDQVQGCFYTS